MRKVCVLIGSRANYGSIKSAMRAIASHPELKLQLVVGASALLDRFGSVVDVIEGDGFTPDAKVTMIVEGVCVWNIVENDDYIPYDNCNTKFFIK